MLLGTVFIVVINQPTPMGASFLTARLVEGSLWTFAAAGALTAPRPTDDDKPLAFHPADAVAAVVVTVVVRVIARGIVLTP